MVPRMARKLGVQYPGAIYYVMNRGDRRELARSAAGNAANCLRVAKEGKKYAIVRD